MAGDDEAVVPEVELAASPVVAVAVVEVEVPVVPVAVPSVELVPDVAVPSVEESVAVSCLGTEIVMRPTPDDLLS